MKINITSIFVEVAITIASLAYFNYLPSHDESVHYHAGYKVYIDGSLQDFTNYKYMNFTPCAEHEVKKSKEEEQIEKAHLHDYVGDVVHVHRTGAVWGDLFKNISAELPTDSKLVGYIDGEKVEDILQKPITNYSTATFVVGNDEADHSKEIISIDHIKEIESKSELCGGGN